MARKISRMHVLCRLKAHITLNNTVRSISIHSNHFNHLNIVAWSFVWLIFELRLYRQFCVLNIHYHIPSNFSNFLSLSNWKWGPMSEGWAPQKRGLNGYGPQKTITEVGLGTKSGFLPSNHTFLARNQRVCRNEGFWWDFILFSGPTFKLFCIPMHAWATAD